MLRKIYLASSWRNEKQPRVVGLLREEGHEVYDFRNPPHGRGGFAWSDIDPAWQSWTPEQYIKALQHPVAVEGFRSDWEAMQWADCCVLLLPCGRSAHLEAGFFASRSDKDLIIFQSEAQEPELMYRMGAVCTQLADLFWLLMRPVGWTSGIPNRRDWPAWINVCSECLQASCWHGEFMCERAKGAGVVKKRRIELEQLALEHPDNWDHQACVEGLDGRERCQREACRKRRST